MSKAPESNPVYVFVVLTLAAFLTLFAFWRTPGIVYETQVLFRVSSHDATDAGTAQLVRSQFEDALLTSESVLEGLRAAGMLEGETTPDMLTISQGIVDRLQVRTEQNQTNTPETWVWLSLATEHPEAAIALLQKMSEQAVTDQNSLLPEIVEASDTNVITATPPTVAGRRGGSIDAYGWFLLAIPSCIVGVVGLVLCDRARNPRVLTSQEQAEQVLPVVGDFIDETQAVLRETLTELDAQQARRRRIFTTVLRAAELAVAAVFLLMVYHLATQNALLDRFITDPLAAYGEVLTYTIG